jgi:hypothetical protein
MTTSFRLLSLALSLCLLYLATPAAAFGCFSYVGESETIAVSLGGRMSAEMVVEYYETLEETEGQFACEAYVQVPLSAFPTWRLATRPADLAPAIRDLASRWGARECKVSVWLRNDTGEDLPPGDECIAGLFRYEGRDWWASSGERRCADFES